MAKKPAGKSTDRPTPSEKADSSEKSVAKPGAKAVTPPAKAAKAPAKKAAAPEKPAPAKPAPAEKAAPAAKATKPAPKAAEKPAPAPVEAAPAAPKAKPAAPKKAAPAKKPAKSAPVVADDLDALDGEGAGEVLAALAKVPAVAAEPVEAEAPAAPKPLPIPTDLPPRRADGTITVAHSPDPDDAFMFYALAAGRVDTEGRRYEHVLKDIQTLNEDAKKGTYDLTAISFHAYPYVRGNYALLTCGASFGDAYGPMLVAKTPIRPSEVEGMKVALPGALTTAALVARLWFGRTKIDARQVPFDKIMDVVRAGLVRAGVIIHEGQLTYKEHGLVRVVDFGQWWSDQTEGLPLPLGGNGIRRDIPADLAAKIALDLKRSIAYALGHREEALAYAMKFGRNLPKDKADKFVGMYVNDLTLDYGERGRQALRTLYKRAVDAKILAELVEPEFIG